MGDLRIELQAPVVSMVYLSILEVFSKVNISHKHMLV